MSSKDDLLEDPRIKKALPNYRNIVLGNAKPKFKSIKLDPKIKAAFDILKKCEFCERKCQVDRTCSQKGYCQLGDKMMVTSYGEHYGEEYFFVPSFTIFFWSCTMNCNYCQNWGISQRKEPADEMSEEELAGIIDENSKCRNINLVGGDPTPKLPFILKTLKYVESSLPILWNSNFYMSEKSMDLLKGAVDVYLPDFKYGNDKCALRLSNAPNYTKIIQRNLKLAFRDSEMVIRHLILPSHVECCSKPVLKFIADNFKDKVIVNIMDQYRPEYIASEFKDINRFPEKEEIAAVIEYAESLGLNYTR